MVAEKSNAPAAPGGPAQDAPAGMDAHTIGHGGDLAQAERVGGTAPWLDLSTGINPYPFPYRPSEQAMTALPQPAAEAVLLAAARTTYGVPQFAEIVAAPGTQAIISWLPRLVTARTVAVIGPTYAEHASAWAAAGARVRSVETPAEAAGADICVIVNPNNPDGRRLSRGEIAEAAERTVTLTVVDEAFMDLHPEETAAGTPGTLVMRSFGKFYGLAGLRLGFAIGAPPLINTLLRALGPWAVSGPALEAGAQALGDDAWGDAMRRTLADDRVDLDAALTSAGFAVQGGTDLYRLAAHPNAAAFHLALAKRGVWTRRFGDRPDRLRFGMPGPAFKRFAAVLEKTAKDL